MPGSAGISVSFSPSAQAGWVKSPVPATVMPLRSAHQARCSMAQSLLQARENLEWDVQVGVEQGEGTAF